MQAGCYPKHGYLLREGPRRPAVRAAKRQMHLEAGNGSKQAKKAKIQPMPGPVLWALEAPAADEEQDDEGGRDDIPSSLWGSEGSHGKLERDTRGEGCRSVYKVAGREQRAPAIS